MCGDYIVTAAGGFFGGGVGRSVAECTKSGGSSTPTCHSALRTRKGTRLIPAVLIPPTNNAGAVSRTAPGETRSRPIRERQSVCPICRVRASVRGKTGRQEPACRPAIGKRYLTGKSLERG
jgi:hypothetical protein